MYIYVINLLIWKALSLFFMREGVKITRPPPGKNINSKKLGLFSEFRNYLCTFPENITPISLFVLE